VTPAWAERGIVALITLLGVQEGRFAWGLLGLVVLALVLVVVALVMGTRALRRSRRALEQLSALVVGGLQAAEPEPEEPQAEPSPPEPGTAEPVAAAEAEPELRPIPEEAEPEEVEAPTPDQTPEPSSAVAPPVAPTDDVLCECGHRRDEHFRISVSKWMCLADVVPACTCRQFVPQGNETASLLRSLQHSDEFVRAVAASELRGRPEATGALLDALADDLAHVRLEVVRALEDAPADTAVRRALIDLIAQDPVPAVRQEAVRVLATFLARV